MTFGYVASFTDAWIETGLFGSIGANKRRIFYRCVDWNQKVSLRYTNSVVASFTDAWIETDRLKVIRNLRARRIFYRCVDWNWNYCYGVPHAA